MTYETIQPDEQPELLTIMMEDMRRARPLYKPGNYWFNLQENLYQQLLKKGLKDFRRKNSDMGRFGAVDFDPYEEFFGTLDKKKKDFMTWQILMRFALKLLGHRDPEKLVEFAYKKANDYGLERKAKPLAEVSTNRIGNPNNVYEIGNRLYSIVFIWKYLEYAFCTKFLDFDAVSTIMEIGPGAGRQVEVIKQLYPKICFFLLDISPEQYVCEQYLKKLFPNDVVSYKKTREMNKIEPEEGKIFIIGNWKLPELENLSYDLFWNSGSFDEMEYDTVKNYLSFVNKQSKYVYLKASMTGVRQAGYVGDIGSIKPVTILDMNKMLSNFSLLKMEKFFQVPRLLPWTSYRQAIWKHN
jgi:putative sugar O-methyltransferase